MRTFRGLYLAAALVVCTSALARGQEIPKATPEGRKALERLLEGCVADGGVEQVGEGAQATWRINVKKLREALATRKERLKPEVRGALVANYAAVARDPARSAERSVLLPVLRSWADVTREPLTLGYASFFTGFEQQGRLQLPEAAQSYEEAAKQFAIAGDLAWQATSINNLGSVLQDRMEYGNAQKFYQQGLEIRTKLYPVERYPQGHSELAQSLNNLGSVLQAQGEYAKALGFYQQALEMSTRLYSAEPYLEGHPELAINLNNIGIIHWAQGEYADALGFYQKALAMRTRLYPQGHLALVTSLDNLGLVYSAQGEYGRAQSLVQQALDMCILLYPVERHPEGRPELAQCLNNMGYVFQAQGEYCKAQGFYQQALHMRTRLYPPERYPQGHSELAASLNNMGYVLQARGEYGEALGFYQQALDMNTKLYPAERYPKGHPLLAVSHNNLGAILCDKREYDKAQGSYEQALDMCIRLYPAERYPQGHPELAMILNNLSYALEAQTKYGKAVVFLDRALECCRSSSDPLDLSEGARAASKLLPRPQTILSLGNRSRLLQRRLTPQSDKAEVRACERSTALTLSLQDRLRDEVLQTDDSKLTNGGNTAEIIPLRVGLCGRLFEMEHDPTDLTTALVTVEQGRARVFLESLGRANASRLAGLSPDLRVEEEGLRRAIRRIDAELRVVQTLPGDEAVARRLRLNQQRLKAEEDLRAFEGKLSASQPRYTALRYPRPCSVEEARRCLDDNEVALLFAVGEEESFAVVLHKNPDSEDPAKGLAVVRLPGRKALSDRVEAVTQRERLKRVGGTPSEGARLYQEMLGPLAEHIRGKDLVIVPDGPLCQLPFELLVEGEGRGRYLIEGHRIRYAPSMTALHMIRLWEDGRKVRPDRPLVAFGDPVFDPNDSRLKDPKSDRLVAAEALSRREGRSRGDVFFRLAASGREVRAVARLLGADDAVHTDFDATEALVKKLSADGGLMRARYIHFATHGVLGFDRGQPPALVLTLVGPNRPNGKEDEYGRDDGLLTLPEVSALRLNADLVTLSACHTGEGRMHAGEGVSGLARVFIYAGSRGVVCSLWSVDDDATADLMRLMYQRLEKGEGTADALRSAKLAMIADGQPPLLWAPFIHMGR